MECAIVNNAKNNDGKAAAARRRGVKRKLRPGDDDLCLAHAAAVPRATAHRALYHLPVARQPLPDLCLCPTASPPQLEHPFINNMDEIAYWIHTKRAPCLMNYDNVLKKQSDQANCSKPKPKSVHVSIEETPPPKKKKLKLSILDDGLSSDEKQKNVYFDTTQDEKQNHKKKALSSCKSGTFYSDVDFNIKNSSVQAKTKRMKLQKNNKTTLHKKNKVITSTPKAPTAALRRSLRHAQNSLNNSHNVSYEVHNCGAVNGRATVEKKYNQKPAFKSKVSIDKKHLNGDYSVQNKKNLLPTSTPKKDVIINGQFEDLSDVSGFTANYIRSTKLHSTTTPRNLRKKSSRSLVKESRQSLHKQDATMAVCINRSMNTTTEMPSPAVLNTSTDSSQNVFNLITMKDNGKCLGVNKSTSLLKFVDAKSLNNNESDASKVESVQANKNNLNVTFQSKRGATSRYPKRRTQHSADMTEIESQTNQSHIVPPINRRKGMKNSAEFHNSDRKENPDEKIVTRMRSRSIALKVQQPKNSVIVLSNVTEQVSSAGTMNVAAPAEDNQPRDVILRKKKRSVTYKKSLDKTGQSLRRDSLRDRSGFAACFSDSDDESELVKQRKFFC